MSHRGPGLRIDGVGFVPRRRLDDDLRRRLADAAFACFVEDGLRETSPLRIAARAGLPVDLVLRVCRSHADTLVLICEVRVGLLAIRLASTASGTLAGDVRLALAPLTEDLDVHAGVLRRQLSSVLREPAARAVLQQGIFCRQAELAVVLQARRPAIDADALAGCVLQRLVTFLDVWSNSAADADALLRRELEVLDELTGPRLLEAS